MKKISQLKKYMQDENQKELKEICKQIPKCEFKQIAPYSMFHSFLFFSKTNVLIIYGWRCAHVRGRR
jgi:hypothetical protein